MPIYGSAPYSITQKFQKMTDSKIALQPFSAVIRLHGKELKISNIFSEEGVFLPWRSSLLPFPMDRGFVVFHYWAPAYGDLNGRSTKGRRENDEWKKKGGSSQWL